jgi:hypothetical protein
MPNATPPAVFARPRAGASRGCDLWFALSHWGRPNTALSLRNRGDPAVSAPKGRGNLEAASGRVKA